VLIHVFVAGMYGLFSNERTLDITMGCFLCFYAVELVLRVVAYGPSEFW